MMYFLSYVKKKKYVLELFGESGLNDIVHCLANRPTLSRSFISFTEAGTGLLTAGNIGV